MTEFQEKLRQQHEESLHRELEALLATAEHAEAQVRTPGAQEVLPDAAPARWWGLVGVGRANICAVQEVNDPEVTHTQP